MGDIMYTVDRIEDDIVILENRNNNTMIEVDIQEFDFDINEGDILKAGTSQNFKIKISYELDSNIAVTFNKPISITFNYVQNI